MAQVGEIVAAWRGKRGLSVREVADLIGVKRQSIEQLEAGEVQQPRYLHRLARVMGYASTDQLLQGFPPPDEGDQAHSVSLSIGYSDAIMTTSVPVVGAAKMDSQGAFKGADLSPAAPIGSVIANTRDPDAYALRVHGDSLYPAVRHGWCLVIEPAGECVPGELVLISMRDGCQVVRELGALRDDCVTVSSANGGSRETIDRADMEWIRPITHLTSSSKFRQA